MAREVIQTIRFVDDLDGSVVDEAEIESITFAYKGTDYKIDLKAQNAKKLDDVMNKYIAAAERLSKRGRPAGSQGKSTRGSGRTKEELQAIRDWANSNGYTVSSRGQIKAEILAAFDAAHA